MLPNLLIYYPECAYLNSPVPVLLCIGRCETFVIAHVPNTY